MKNILQYEKNILWYENVHAVLQNFLSQQLSSWNRLKRYKSIPCPPEDRPGNCNPFSAVRVDMVCC